MISSHEEMQRDKVKSELRCVELEEQQDMLQREGDGLKETIDSLKSTLADFEARIGAALADKAGDDVDRRRLRPIRKWCTAFTANETAKAARWRRRVVFSLSSLVYMDEIYT